MSIATPSSQPRTRIQATLSRVTEEDLLGVAEGQLLAFGERLYGEVEPPSIRAPVDNRCRRFARRFLPLVNRKDVLIMKATVSDISERTGRPVIAALAFWHLPGAPIDNCQKRDEAKMDQESGEEKEAYVGYDWRAWNKMLEDYDVVRRQIMGEKPHWYLGPLWTHPDYQGQGLAGQLVRHAIALADADNPPRAMYLEASPAGAPVYARYGFERVEGTKTVMLRKAIWEEELKGAGR
ncbi:hypothetical protein JCM11641_008221 [Rhodosporidiobolus odoratus]